MIPRISFDIIIGFIILIFYDKLLSVSGATDASSGTAVDNKPVAFIHIGPPRSSSNHIQKMLDAHRWDLFETNFKILVDNDLSDLRVKSSPVNVFFLGSVLNTDVSQYNKSLISSTGNKLLENNGAKAKYSEIFKNFQEYVAKCFKRKQSLIIATESFGNLEYSNIAKTLSRELSGFRTIIIMTYKDYASMGYSLFQQVFMNSLFSTTPIQCNKKSATLKGNLNFEQFYNLCSESDPKFPFGHLSILPLVDHWSQYFGKENMRIIDYNGAHSMGHDLFHALWIRILRTEVKHETKLSISVGEDKDNVPLFLNIPQIVKAAHDRDLIPKTCHPHSALVHNLRSVELPKKCLSRNIIASIIEQHNKIDEELRKKWEKQIIMGKNVGDKVIRKKFESGVFCWIDEDIFFNQEKTMHAMNKTISKHCRN